MAELFNLKKGEERVVKIGKTFQDGCSDFYHTIRYDFKPASVDNQKCGIMDIEEKEVNVRVPLLEGHGAQEAMYKGSKTPASKDYVLVVDHNTGEITLEKFGYHIRVKRTRVERKSQAHKLSPYQRQSPSQVQSGTGLSPNKPSPRQSPPGTSKLQKPSAAPSLAPGSMPFLQFEDNKQSQSSYNHSIMSDSSSDSDSNSGSSSSSDSESDSEQDTRKPSSNPNGMPDIKMRNGYNNSPNILDDLNLSEED